MTVTLPVNLRVIGKAKAIAPKGHLKVYRAVWQIGVLIIISLDKNSTYKVGKSCYSKVPL